MKDVQVILSMTIIVFTCLNTIGLLEGLNLYEYILEYLYIIILILKSIGIGKSVPLIIINYIKQFCNNLHFDCGM